ncbi:cytochrome P450 4c21-like [Sabethes cyaneus]|uniref:cytochrome P450 4c21-like n=1 Tax=Sabethes cyaneus TaxID=53552 RepID=UPI00237EB4FB|nr:cytochrome P450 4c21-like [Sabethes cyaneus]
MAFAENLPTVQPCYPLIGNGMNVLWKTDEERFSSMMGGFQNPAKLFKAWLAVVPLICTGDPEMIQKILNHPQCLQKAPFYDMIRCEFGLFVAHYNIWKRQRKALNSTFNVKILNGFVPIFDRHAQVLVEDLLKYPTGKKVQITSYTIRCALAMVCGTTIGCDIHEDQKADKFSQLFDTIAEMVSMRMVNPILHVEFIYRLTSSYKMEKAARTEIYGFINKNAKIQRASRTEPSESSDQGDYRKPKIFIDQLLDLYEQNFFSETEVFDNVITMIAAGTDTSGTILGIIAHMLAIHPQLQEKVYQEIKKVFPAHDELSITPEKLGQLQYTEMFIKETLRLFPITPIIMRKTMREIELDEIKIPAGTLLTVCIHSLHRRTEIWGSKAEEFNPENFTSERIESRHPFAYIPFSGGNRNCIGFRYAMNSMKTVIVHLLLNFKLKSDLMRASDLRLKFAGLLKLSAEPGLTLEQRA